jgi:hypothetical protein
VERLGRTIALPECFRFDAVREFRAMFSRLRAGHACCDCAGQVPTCIV